MKIENKILIGFALLVVVLLLGRYLFDSGNPVVLSQESFQCAKNACEYKFELKNTSSEPHSGTVYVHFRDNLGVGGYKSTASKLRSLELPFALEANESIVISDVYKTNRENVEIYYAVSTNET